MFDCGRKMSIVCFTNLDGLNLGKYVYGGLVLKLSLYFQLPQQPQKIDTYEEAKNHLKLFISIHKFKAL
jgi:hypothetical protein